MLKVMSKMGISTFQSYNGAQIFDAVGLDSEFTKMYFKGTVSLIGGAGFQEIIYHRPTQQSASVYIYIYIYK